MNKPLHEMTQKEVLDQWRKARGLHFNKLRAAGLSLAKIGIKYGITRQAVSQFIHRASLIS